MVSVSVFHIPIFPDLIIADFDLFRWSKQQLSGRIVDSQQNLLETVTEILNELPKNEVKLYFLHWKKRCHWAADHNREFYPRELNGHIF
jgi:hypothetical protein